MSKARTWTDDEIAQLGAAWLERDPDEKATDFDHRLATEMGRTKRAVENQRRRQGLLADVGWSQEDDDRLRAAWEEYRSSDVETRGTVKDFDLRMAAELETTQHATTRRRHDVDPPLKLDQGGTQPQPAPTTRPGSGIKDELRDMDLLDYTLIEGNYYFPVGGGLWSVDEETWEWVCGQYSSEGANRTAKEIARDLAWPVGVLQTCLRQAKQYKASLPMSRETIIHEPVEHLAERTYAEKEKAAVAQFHRMRDRRWERKYRDVMTERHSEERMVALAAEVMGDFRAPAMETFKFTQGSSDTRDWIAHVPTTDEHLGKLIWSNESLGGQNFDTKIAAEWLRGHADIAAEWLASEPGFCNRVYRTWLGDLLHALLGQTESGTPLHQDTRAQKVWKTVIETSIYSIEALRAPGRTVVVLMVPGNHEGATISFMLQQSLGLYYTDAEDVEIRIHPGRYAAFDAGKSLHVLDHGKGQGKLTGWKAKAQAEVVAREVGGDFYAQAEHIYYYSAHLHQREVSTQGRHMELIRLEAFAPTDDFETGLRYCHTPAARLFRLDDLGRIGTEKVVYADALEPAPA